MAIHTGDTPWVDQLKPYTDEIERLRKGIEGYLNGDYGFDFKTKHDQCLHGRFQWEACENCIDEYFTTILNPKDGRDD